MRSSGNTFRNGDCSSATASATFNAPSNTGSPVVLSEVGEHDRVLFRERRRAPAAEGRQRQRDERDRRHDDDGRGRQPPRSDPRRDTTGRRRWAGSRQSRRPTAGRSRGSGDSACRMTPFELRVDVRHQRRRPRRLRRVARSAERMLADDELVEHEAERVEVGALGQRRARQELLGRHVAGRADERVQTAGRPCVTAIPKSVIRTWPLSSIRTLAGFRSRCSTPCACAAASPAAQLAGDVDDLLRRQAADALEQRRQILPAHQLHREEHFAVGLADVEHAADRRMRDLAREPHFVEDGRGRARRAPTGSASGRPASRAPGRRRARRRPCRPRPRRVIIR